MTSSASESLGPLIKRLRKDRGLSQKQLGERVGYAGGAAISILRIEKQGVVPGPDRLDKLAEELGVDPRVLHDASRRVLGDEAQTEAFDIGARIDRLKREESRRLDLERDLQLLDAARERANTDFLLRLRAVGHQLEGTLLQLPENPSDSGQSEAAYRIKLARAGVEKALTDSMNGALGYGALATSIAAGAQSAASSIPNFARSAIALSALTAVLRVAQPTARLNVSVGNTMSFAVALVGGVASSAIIAKTKSKRDKLLADLERAESEVIDSTPSFEALEAAVASATRLFEDISLYGARAISRWETAGGGAENGWGSLPPADQQSYLALVDVAASQIAVESISLQDLATLRGPDLQAARRVAEEVLAEAHAVVAARI